MNLEPQAYRDRKCKGIEMNPTIQQLSLVAKNKQTFLLKKNFDFLIPSLPHHAKK